MSNFARKLRRHGNMSLVKPNDPLRVITEIKIMGLSNGQIRVTGPLAKADLCKAMLSEAIKVVDGFQREIEKQIITPDQNVIITPQ